MPTRRPIQPGIHFGPEDPARDDEAAGAGVASSLFRDALALWAAGVGVVAVREGPTVHATTVTSFAPVSAEPPLVVVSLGAGAQVLPFLEEGSRFAVSFLSGEQRRLAVRFADSFPVGALPFPEEGDPVVPGALMSLTCGVENLVPAGPSRLAVARVEDGGVGDPGDGALLYWRRGYRVLRE